MAPPPSKLRKGLAKVLAFIESELAAGRPFPKAAAIGAHMGWRANLARDALTGLAAAGVLVGSPPAKLGGAWTYRLAPAPAQPHEAAPPPAPLPPLPPAEPAEL